MIQRAVRTFLGLDTVVLESSLDMSLSMDSMVIGEGIYILALYRMTIMACNVRAQSSLRSGQSRCVTGRTVAVCNSS